MSSNAQRAAARAAASRPAMEESWFGALGVGEDSQRDDAARGLDAESRYDGDWKAAQGRVAQ
ncbi:MAG TPA: hypothetical protein VFV25_13370, partial [Methylibium sp.]